LADSLKVLFETLGIPGADDGQLAMLLRLIEAGPVSPSLFGAYVELVLAVFDERDADAELFAQELLHWPFVPTRGALRIVTLKDQDLGQGQAARYRRRLKDDLPGEIEPLEGEALADAAHRLRPALNLIKVGIPDLFEEMQTLIQEIVLVAPAKGPPGLEFDFGGASTFSLWGALVLNGKSFGDRLDIAVSLAHEAAHTYLFGLARGGRLTENDLSESFVSPLRQDLRPMEGVVHAAYVTARMIYALEALIRSGQLDADEIVAAREQLHCTERAHAEGLATVSAHASFTPPGAAAFAALGDYMERRLRADDAA
jgi:HEXXH motif-containing protein